MASLFNGDNRSPECCRAKVRNSHLVSLYQVIDALDIFCGCGGMSFVDMDAEETVLPDGTIDPGVRIETRWAVDMDPSMCDTFRTNYPNAKVRYER